MVGGALTPGSRRRYARDDVPVIDKCDAHGHTPRLSPRRRCYRAQAVANGYSVACARTQVPVAELSARGLWRARGRRCETTRSAS